MLLAKAVIGNSSWFTKTLRIPRIFGKIGLRRRLPVVGFSHCPTCIRCDPMRTKGQCQVLFDVYRTILKWLLSLAGPDQCRLIAGFDEREINREVG
ncbi:hypothetical protein Y032_0261g541 [Ancylostoma ceylanicum]|uniref:Uncharacterized protein n=1 Tax=Ancylostoma ceylanicum TaxID=53326 RepID=A0A016SB35_9BILA|nr:hypothetical protein Y032_0261g541 [Ancylostoma ceylanicum]